MDKDLKKKILGAQKSEITEHLIYKILALKVKSKNNKAVLEQISGDELKHYRFWRDLSKQELEPNKFKVIFYVFIARVFGLAFGVKLMEKVEIGAQADYNKLKGFVPDIEEIIDDEIRHEKELLGLVNEAHLEYSGSVVLGLNDALVELTGALAGLTLALQNTRLVALVGLITGVAAAMSMAVSEYLATKEEANSKNPFKASIYTGIAYIFTVFFLIFPYFILTNIFMCLGWVVINAVLVIFIFTFYTSVAKGVNFKKRFAQMVVISLGVAAISFFVGLLVRSIWGIEA